MFTCWVLELGGLRKGLKWSNGGLCIDHEIPWLSPVYIFPHVQKSCWAIKSRFCPEFVLVQYLSRFCSSTVKGWWEPKQNVCAWAKGGSLNLGYVQSLSLSNICPENVHDLWLGGRSPMRVASSLGFVQSLSSPKYVQAVSNISICQYLSY